MDNIIEDQINKYCLTKGISNTNIIYINLNKKEIPKDLKFIYILDNDADYPYIIKCPIIASSRNTYTINIKTREKTDNTYEGELWTTYEHYTEKKILKSKINSHPGYDGMTSYPFALANLLLLQKNHILDRLYKSNDVEAYKRYIIASKRGLIFGLEYIARYFKMHYIFRLEDDTTLNQENIEEISNRYFSQKIIKNFEPEDVPTFW